tara:strand:- start:2646 stop:2924 length:279 start_codon:yes stop_codon:yes gene_type:complete
MNVIKNVKSLGVIAVITISSLSFLTIRGETNKISNEIVALKIKKKMILDNKISLNSKKNRLISQNRIEKIARDSLGMYKQNIINKEIDLSVK